MGLKKEQCIKKSLMIREQNITIFLWKIFKTITFYVNPSGPISPGGHFLQKSISLFLIIFFKIFIFAITADAFAEDMAKALAAGMNDHVSKPIDYKRLIRVLEKNIE